MLFEDKQKMLMNSMFEENVVTRKLKKNMVATTKTIIIYS